jgi:DMSO/TMAO reductase YedYZ molybdopterin-dependent catalytic subunit
MTIFRYLVVLTTVILLAASVSSCVSGTDMDKSKELGSVYIKEYKGEKLSSISEFRENSIKGPQSVDISTYKLFVKGLVENEKSYSYEDIINKYQHYQKLITLECVEGWSVKILWEGVLVKDLLTEAGIKPEARIVIFHAVDGYTTSLPLQYILNKNILLAFKMNGLTIPEARGFPFQLAAEDRWGYKWIKWVDKIELSDDESYRGYWEQAGYSNDGSLDKSFFDR